MFVGNFRLKGAMKGVRVRGHGEDNSNLGSSLYSLIHGRGYTQISLVVARQIPKFCSQCGASYSFNLLSCPTCHPEGNLVICNRCRKAEHSHCGGRVNVLHSRKPCMCPHCGRLNSLG